MASTSIKFAGGVSAKDALAFSQEMRCSDEFILGARKRDREKTSEFAVWIKNTTDQASKITVPLGFMETKETIADEHYDVLLDRNRKQYSASFRERPEETGERDPPALQGVLNSVSPKSSYRRKDG